MFPPRIVSDSILYCTKVFEFRELFSDSDYEKKYSRQEGRVVSFKFATPESKIKDHL